jgi:hypothetical protein
LLECLSALRGKHFQKKEINEKMNLNFTPSEVGEQRHQAHVSASGS